MAIHVQFIQSDTNASNLPQERKRKKWPQLCTGLMFNSDAAGERESNHGAKPHSQIRLADFTQGRAHEPTFSTRKSDKTRSGRKLKKKSVGGTGGLNVFF